MFCRCPADFFITMLNTNMFILTAVAWAIYLTSFFFFSIWYYVIMKSKPDCLYGATTYVECWTLSFVVQMTIGACRQPGAGKQGGARLGGTVLDWAAGHINQGRAPAVAPAEKAPPLLQGLATRGRICAGRPAG